MRFFQLSKELIAQFYNTEIAETLEHLVHKHLFIQPIATNGLYRFHSLFSRFLEMKWQQNAIQYTVLHKKQLYIM